MINNIFFDFDGVLAESMDVKSQAFFDLYRPFGESVAEAVRSYHLQHGGVSRYEKFRHCHRHLLDIELDDAGVAELAGRFSELVTQAVIECPEVPGTSAFLQSWHPTLRFWIVTGTPGPEMEIIANARGIRPYFIEICGSPQGKTEWVAQLLEKYRLSPEETLFVGDARSDLDAAHSAGLPFVLRETTANKALFHHFIGPRIKDLHGLPAFLNRTLPPKV
ncbi:MAG: hypothetical protein RLY31_162 [Bacteroidota bacterium]